MKYVLRIKTSVIYYIRPIYIIQESEHHYCIKLAFNTRINDLCKFIEFRSNEHSYCRIRVFPHFNSLCARSQMSKLRNMYSNPETDTDVKLTHNYRPTQSVNTRMVFKYTDAFTALRCTAPSALSARSSLIALITALLVCSGNLLS